MTESGLSRRRFLEGAAVVSAGTAVAGVEVVLARDGAGPAAEPGTALRLTLNGQLKEVTAEPRTTLLDLLREHLGLTGTKKGCDRGQCGACTVHIGGHTALSCLTLAATVHEPVTTIEGLADGGQLHPVQQAFLEQDGMQCGFCTPGQIMSASALVAARPPGPPGLPGPPGPLVQDDEIREYMSGNICRCSAYPNIVAAVRQACGGGG